MSHQLHINSETLTIAEYINEGVKRFLGSIIRPKGKFWPVIGHLNTLTREGGVLFGYKTHRHRTK